MRESGAPLNQDNVNLVANKFFANGGDELFKKVKKNLETIRHNTLENADEQYLFMFMAYKAFLRFFNFSKEKDKKYEYKVESITDGFFGGARIQSLTNILNSYGREGWSLKSAFTNELGKNEAETTIKGVSVGINSTTEQTILIFEREIKR